jgi:hypothetical protein
MAGGFGMKIFLCFAGYLLVGFLVMLGAIFISNKCHKHWFHDVGFSGRLYRNYFEFSVLFVWPVCVIGYTMFLLFCWVASLTGKLLPEPPRDPLVDFLKASGVPSEDVAEVIKEVDSL